MSVVNSYYRTEWPCLQYYSIREVPFPLLPNPVYSTDIHSISSTEQTKVLLNYLIYISLTIHLIFLAGHLFFRHRILMLVEGSCFGPFFLLLSPPIRCGRRAHKLQHNNSESFEKGRWKLYLCTLYIGAALASNILN